LASGVIPCLLNGRGNAMKPSRTSPSGTDDLFRSRLDNIIDMRHELVRLAGVIDWAFFDDGYEAF